MAERRALRIATAVFFLGALSGFAALYLRMAILWDADSYYHLAVARLYAHEGLFATIPWARFSLLAQGGDKDLLFHIALMPFVSVIDPSTGGRLALAVINALLAATIGNLAARAIGLWGFVVPLWLWIAAPPFFARVVRLRPELGALLIILIAIPFAARRRWLALGVLAAAFTWAYTAFHVFLALCVLWWIVERRPRSADDGRQPAAALLWPFLGALIALIVRPHPIANGRLWFVQNVEFFLNFRRLDAGNEILPPSLGRVAAATAAWLAALVVLAVVAARSRERLHPFTRAAAVPAIVFTILFLAMSRMALYVFPLATVAILFAIGPSLAIHDSGLRTSILPITLAVSTLLAIPLAANPLFVRLVSGAPVLSEADWTAFGRAVPRGAKVAATWGDAEIYAFWAPQGRYLDVLDPVFMALPYPRQYAIQRAMFGGAWPDVPFAAKAGLDSDWIALDWSDAPRIVIDRIRSDPRLRIVYGGYNLLAAIVPTDAFVLDWIVTPDGTSAPQRYPLASLPLRPFEGFVDARRVTSSRCATFTRHDVGPRRYAFAPYGKSAIALDGRVVLVTDGVAADLARAVPFELPPGPQRIDVRTCEAGGYNGFFLRR